VRPHDRHLTAHSYRGSILQIVDNRYRFKSGFERDNSRPLIWLIGSATMKNGLSRVSEKGHQSRNPAETQA